MSSLENSLFQLKFTSKTLKKEALKAKKEEKSEKGKVKKHIQQGEQVLARIYAQNAIRKAQESVNLLRLASRIDAVSSRVNTAVVMRNVTGSMRNVVRGMDKAMQHMNLEQISGVMDKFEQQFEDLDVQSGYMENVCSELFCCFYQSYAIVKSILLLYPKLSVAIAKSICRYRNATLLLKPRSSIANICSIALIL